MGFEILNSNLILKLGLKSSNFINKTFNKNAIFLFSQGGDTLGGAGGVGFHTFGAGGAGLHTFGDIGAGFHTLGITGAGLSPAKASGLGRAHIY